MSVFCAAFVACGAMVNAAETFRRPAVPLITCDPYFSVWSPSDNLWEAQTTHWTGRAHRLGALVRVDGHAYRLMGASPQTVAAMKQTSVTVLPTRTVYEFTGHGVAVKLTFTTPALPDDVLLLSRPVTYVNCEATSRDGKTHAVEFYFDACGELATDRPNQMVSGATESGDRAESLKLGTVSQQVLGKSGDDLRIDWGYLYVAADKASRGVYAFGNVDELRESFDQGGSASLTNRTVTFPMAASQVSAAVAIHCRQTTGGQFIGFGLVEIAPAEAK